MTLPVALRALGPALLAAAGLLGCAKTGQAPAPARSDTAPPVAATAANAPSRNRVQARDAWIRLLPGDLPAAGYVVLHNDGDTARTLVAAGSAAFGSVMLHQSIQDSGMSHMRHVEGVPVPAHGTATLGPGGYHLMLMQATRALAPGQTVDIDLQFDDGATLSVPFTVKPANTTD